MVEFRATKRDIAIILMMQKLLSRGEPITQIDVACHLGVSVKTIERRLARIKECGWMTVTRLSSKRWKYEFTESCPFTLCMGPERESEGVMQIQISGSCNPSKSTDFCTLTGSNIISLNKSREDHNMKQTTSVPSKIAKEEDSMGIKVFGSNEASLARLKKTLESVDFTKIQKPKKVRSSQSDFSEEKDDFFLYKKKPSLEKKEEAIESTLNCRQMWYVFKSLWKEHKFSGNPCFWTVRELKNVKDLIEEQGDQAVMLYFQYCFTNWRTISMNHKIMSVVPTVPILFGYRRSLLPEALSVEPRALISGAEYTETDIQTGSWG